MGLFFAGLVFEISQIWVLNNTIHGQVFFIQYALFGLGIATAVALLLQWIIPSVYDESDLRYTLCFGLFLGFPLFVPALASYINHSRLHSTEQCTTYTIKQKSIGGRNNARHTLYLSTVNTQIEQFIVAPNIYNTVFEGQNISVCAKKGQLGYYYVTNIAPK